MADGGDVIATLFDQHVGELFRYASRLVGADRMLAEDLVQDAFLALSREIDRTELPRLPIAWLKRVVRNRFVDVTRSATRESLRMQRLVAQPASGVSGSSDIGFLATLPPDQRLAMVLRYVDDMSVVEVAKQLGRTVAATESLLARARSSARACIEGADR